MSSTPGSSCSLAAAPGGGGELPLPPPREAQAYEQPLLGVDDSVSASSTAWNNQSLVVKENVLHAEPIT